MVTMLMHTSVVCWFSQYSLLCNFMSVCVRRGVFGIMEALQLVPSYVMNDPK